MGIYNVGNVLSESIDSIINQSFNDWEFIICDDGSKDNTYEIALSYKKQYPDKIVLLKNKKNMGLEYTLNKCLSLASGEYIARQDGDDKSRKNRLKIEVDFLDRHKKYALVGSNMDFFDENGVWGHSRFAGEVKDKDFASYSPFMHPTVMIRKNAILEVGGYTEKTNLTRVEDYDLWLKIYLHGYKGYNIKTSLYEYRDDRNAFSKRTIKNRISLFYIMEQGVNKLKLPFYYKIKPFKQLVLIILPSRLYGFIHRLKYKSNKRYEK